MALTAWAMALEVLLISAVCTYFSRLTSPVTAQVTLPICADHAASYQRQAGMPYRNAACRLARTEH